MIRRRKPRFYDGEFRDIRQAVLAGKQGGLDGEISRFEESFENYTGADYAIASGSGRRAMSLLFDAYGLKKGDEVLMSAYTLKDLVRLTIDRGLVPRLVDVDARSFNMDPEKVKENITDKTRMIVATHIFGLPCDIGKILSIARPRGITVIEDCAHALGAKVNGRKVGSIADAGFFSFETIKPLNTFAGGMVTTSDRSIADKVRTANGGEGALYPFLRRVSLAVAEEAVTRTWLYNLLIRALSDDNMSNIVTAIYKSAHKSVGLSRGGFTSAQAILGLRQLPQLDALNAKRGRIAASLNSKLNSRAVLQYDPELSKDRVFYFFVVRVSGRLKVPVHSIRRMLVRRGIDAGVGHEITDDCALQLPESGGMVSSKIYKTALQLPLHDDLSEDEVDRIATVFNDILKEVCQ